MTRSPPPSAEETAALVASLRETVTTMQWRAGASRVRDPDRPGRVVLVRPDGDRSGLELVENGQRLAARDVDTGWLLAHLAREGQTYPVLAAVLDEHA